ncbi:MAG: hypothetical protein ABWW65_05280 [Thermoprotei archaeon]
MKTGIRDILGSSSGLEKVMGDVLRVLGLYRRLWLSEIYMEISGMNSTLKDEVPDYNIVEKAVIELSKMGYVTLEKRIRGVPYKREGVEEYLVTLIENPEVLMALQSDKKLMEYVRIRSEILGT